MSDRRDDAGDEPAVARETNFRPFSYLEQYMGSRARSPERFEREWRLRLGDSIIGRMPNVESFVVTTMLHQARTHAINARRLANNARSQSDFTRDVIRFFGNPPPGWDHRAFSEIAQETALWAAGVANVAANEAEHHNELAMQDLDNILAARGAAVVAKRGLYSSLALSEEEAMLPLHAAATAGEDALQAMENDRNDARTSLETVELANQVAILAHDVAEQVRHAVILQGETLRIEQQGFLGEDRPDRVLRVLHVRCEQTLHAVRRVIHDGVAELRNILQMQRRALPELLVDIVASWRRYSARIAEFRIDPLIEEFRTEVRRIERRLRDAERAAGRGAPPVRRNLFPELENAAEPAVAEPAAVIDLVEGDEDPVVRSTSNPEMSIAVVSSASVLAQVSRLLPGITVCYYEDTEPQRPIEYIYIVCAPTATHEEIGIVHDLRNTFAAVMEEMDSREIAANREEQAHAYPRHPPFGVFRLRRSRVRLCTAVDVSGLAALIPSMQVRFTMPAAGDVHGVIISFVRVLAEHLRSEDQSGFNPTQSLQAIAAFNSRGIDPAQEAQVLQALQAQATHISTRLNVVLQDISTFLNRGVFGRMVREVLLNIRIASIEFENRNTQVTAIIFSMTATQKELELIRFIINAARQIYERLPPAATPFMIDDIFGQLPNVPETCFFDTRTGGTQVFGVTNSANLGNDVDIRVNLRLAVTRGLYGSYVLTDGSYRLSVVVGPDANPNDHAIADMLAQSLVEIGIPASIIKE